MAMISLVAMFILLTIQFRSVLKPVLIFLAIPFSLFGVAFGLYITGNDLSFFSMIGFIGLIGIVVNNTILLVDAASRYKRQGNDSVESIAKGLQERFRPLFTTTFTTVVALTPLALSDPFWEPLAVTIIFGLISSTILVILSFPAYYIVFDETSDWFKRSFKKVFSR
jgi:HAE1 family hydrophobic/amphiphilic exporter-1